MTAEEEIVDLIFDQPNRLATLIGILDGLPVGLAEWFMGTVNTIRKSSDFTEVDISTYVNLRIGLLPADIILRKNRDPALGDIIEICVMGDENTYITGTVKVTKINVKEGTLNIQNLAEPNGIGTIMIQNVIDVIECIEYGSERWHQIVQTLNIEFDVNVYRAHAESILEQVREAEDQETKDEMIEKLESRLDILSNAV